MAHSILLPSLRCDRHIDCGKSTLAGHLSVLLGEIKRVGPGDGRRRRHDEEPALDELEKTANELGKGSFRFAFVCDRTKQERERGITYNINVRRLRSPRCDWTVLDTAGLRCFFWACVEGLSLADVTVVRLFATYIVRLGEADRSHRKNSLSCQPKITNCQCRWTDQVRRFVRALSQHGFMVTLSSWQSTKWMLPGCNSARAAFTRWRCASARI